MSYSGQSRFSRVSLRIVWVTRSLISAIISRPLALCSCLPSSISWLHSSLLFQLHPRLLWTTCVFLAVSGHVLPLITTVFRKQDMRGSSSCHTKAPNGASNHGDEPINSVTSLQFKSDVVSQGWAPEWVKKQISCMFYCYIFWKMEEVSRKRTYVNISVILPRLGTDLHPEWLTNSETPLQKQALRQKNAGKLHCSRVQLFHVIKARCAEIKWTREPKWKGDPFEGRIDSFCSWMITWKLCDENK